MSKSTPIMQLQGTPGTDPEDAINQINMEMAGGAPPQQHAANPHYSNALPYYGNAGSYAAGTTPLPPARKALCDPRDVKFFLLVAVVYLLLSNDPVVNALCGKVPGMKNPLVCVLVRALLAGLIVTVAQRFL